MRYNYVVSVIKIRVSSKQNFTPQEDEILKRHYAIATKAELMQMLPGRESWESIRMRAFKLGLKRSSQAKSYEMGKPIEGKFIAHLTEAEKGYLAGIIDGEGCIMLARRKPKGKSDPVYAVYVGIGNTSTKLLEWLNEKLPGRSYVQSVSKSRIGTKPGYSWIISGNRQCIAFLEEIEPYLIIKKEQAKLLIEGYVHLSPQERENLWMRLREIKKEL